MPLSEKQQRVRDPERPGYAVFKRRSRIKLYILVLLVLLVLGLGAYLFSGIFEGTSDEPPEQIDTPAPEQEETEDTVDREKGTEEEATEAVAVPDDPTLYLTVPRLGIYHHTVRNDRSEEALGLGAVKLPGTDFPWQKGSTNTYIACHRIGFPGTESFHQCLNLPSMQQGDEVILEDTNGTVYRYRISEFLQVAPGDTWVTEPVDGREMISLQTCTETFNDFATLGPNWAVRFIARADRIS
jgi:sortase A